MFRTTIYPALLALTVVSVLLLSWLFPLNVSAHDMEGGPDLEVYLPNALYIQDDEPPLHVVDNEQPSEDTESTPDGLPDDTPSETHGAPSTDSNTTVIYVTEEGSGELSADDLHQIRLLLEFAVYGLVPFVFAAILCFSFTSWFLRSFVGA